MVLPRHCRRHLAYASASGSSVIDRLATDSLTCPRPVAGVAAHALCGGSAARPARAQRDRSVRHPRFPGRQHVLRQRLQQFRRHTPPRGRAPAERVRKILRLNWVAGSWVAICPARITGFQRRRPPPSRPTWQGKPLAVTACDFAIALMSASAWHPLVIVSRYTPMGVRRRTDGGLVGTRVRRGSGASSWPISPSSSAATMRPLEALQLISVLWTDYLGH